MPSFTQRVYAFDVDDTLKMGPRPGPVDSSELKKLMDQGHIIGLCGNHRIVFQHWPLWYTVIAFFGGHPPLGSYKPQFLMEIKQSIYMGNQKIQDYVMVGNSKMQAQAGLATPTANDDGYARLAGWRFILADDFAAGVR